MTGFPEEKVRKQVDRILTSPEFKNSKKLCQFLNYVVGQMLSGNTDGITQYAIAVGPPHSAGTGSIL